MSDMVLLRDIPWGIDAKKLARRLHIKPASGPFFELESLCEEALRVARPVAMARAVYIDAVDDCSAVIDGQRFVSRVLAVNLVDQHRAFAYVASCGQELQAWADSIDDLLLQYEAEAIKEVALSAAIKALKHAIDDQFHPGKTSTMAPGSLADWPIREQRPLFELLGNTQGLVGVELGESMLMTPNKSVSGLRFAVESDFYSCMLCPREKCPERRMVYQPDLYADRYPGATRSKA